MHEIKLSTILDKLWSWAVTGKDRPALKDTTRVSSAKFDFYLESTTSDPLSFSIFELSDRGELLVHDAEKLADSKAAYFLFVNTDKNFMVMVKNTLENCKRLVRGENVENMKVKIIV